MGVQGDQKSTGGYMGDNKGDESTGGYIGVRGIVRVWRDTLEYRLGDNKTLA